MVLKGCTEVSLVLTLVLRDTNIHRPVAWNGPSWYSRNWAGLICEFGATAGQTFARPPTSSSGCSIAMYALLTTWVNQKQIIFPIVVKEIKMKSFLNFFLKNYFIYLLLERGEGREKEKERSINVWLSLLCPLLGAWPTTQACALTRNRTGNPSVRSPHSKMKSSVVDHQGTPNLFPSGFIHMKGVKG